ncbi:MAG: hypothetical protein M1416_02280, partial [Candidatus Pacearchaeota archaeon]|nr:hypothetical protein [Candidatus Pacearchaeota archaeon]
DKKLGYITSEIKTILKGASIYYFSDIIDKNRHKDFTKKILDSFLTQKEKDYLENGLRNWTLFKLPTSDK